MRDAKHLLNKFKAGTCTEEEMQLIEKWAFNHRAGESAGLTEDDFEQASIDIWAGIQHNRDNGYSPKIRLWQYVSAAASIVLCCFIGGYFLLKKPVAALVAKPAIQHQKTTISPGQNKAILTLSNGETIVLAGAQNGKLATQGNTAITKTAEGQIIYRANKQNNRSALANDVVYNTVATPRGGQYQITLPDGSRVWLNAASSIKYPTAFTGKGREVELTGEAYFEIAKDPQKPFSVRVSDKQQIEVLGTHFNVEAYTDDRQIKTTLLEGSVKLLYGHKQAILKPGQMAINNLTAAVVIKEANIEEVMAWKNGLFVFNDENIKEVMKKAARWYDFDVEYLGDVHKKKFGGVISKYKNITELLDNMNISGGIHYKIDGRRVILMN